MPFGKYKGWLIEDVLDHDPKYLEWLASQPDFPEKRPYLYQIIIENGLGPEDAPEPEATISLAKHSPFGCCCTCGGPARFGYRDKANGEMRWYCAEHRLAQCWGEQSTGPSNEGARVRRCLPPSPGSRRWNTRAPSSCDCTRAAARSIRRSGRPRVGRSGAKFCNAP